MTVSLAKVPAQVIDPQASYTAWVFEDNTRTIAHPFGIISGSTALECIRTSANPHLLEFTRLT